MPLHYSETPNFVVPSRSSASTVPFDRNSVLIAAYSRSREHVQCSRQSTENGIYVFTISLRETWTRIHAGDSEGDCVVQERGLVSMTLGSA